MGTVRRDGCWIRAVEGMGKGSSDGRIRDAEHRFLEADADLHMGIHLATTMVVVPLAQLLGEIAEHVRHAKTGGDARAHAGNGIGVKGSVLEAADIGGDLLSLGVI